MPYFNSSSITSTWVGEVEVVTTHLNHAVEEEEEQSWELIAWDQMWIEDQIILHSNREI